MTDLRTRDEVDPASRGRRGAHRAAPSRLAVLLPLVVVVVAAVVVLTVLALVLLTGLGGRGAGGDVLAGAPAATPTTSAPPTATAPTTTAVPTEEPTDEPTEEPSPSPSDGAGSGGSDARSSSTAPGVDEGGAGDGAAPPPGGDAGDTGARGAPVVVLNATRTSGLAARTADDLRGEGWSISRTGTVDGSGEATVVRYRDPALESAAQAVAASLDGADVERDEGAEEGVVTVVTGPDRVGR